MVQDLLSSKFLITLFEFHIMKSNFNEWEEAILKETPPLYYRFLQLNSMLKAMEIDCRLSDFVKGLFLGNGVIIEYEDIYRDILNEFKIPIDDIKFNEQGDVFVSFLALYFFRKTLYHSFHESLTILRDGAGNYGNPERILKYLEIELNRKIEFIDNILCFMIDPKKRKFDAKILIEKYGYPDVDIYEIDLEWV